VLIFCALWGRAVNAESADAASAPANLSDDATWAGAVLSGAARAVTSAAANAPAAATDPESDAPGALQARRAALLARAVRIEEVAANNGCLDLSAVLRKLAHLEVNEVLVEAGPTLAGQLLATFLADELLLYVAPKLLGPQGRPLVNLPELQSLQDAWGFSLFDAKRFGDDLRLRLRPK
jgi:diaminohydroxyphosphoribosylaminopyrimidine deaminase / 5-amino-6-(5-phosphoribosylamino)uracil reductase